MTRKIRKTKTKKDSAKLSFADAAERVLIESGSRKPMHYTEITKIAKKKKYVKTSGKTPEITMLARISEEIRLSESNGGACRFYRLPNTSGYYGLSKFRKQSKREKNKQSNKKIFNNRKNTENMEKYLSYLDAAEIVLREFNEPMNYKEITQIAVNRGYLKQNSEEISGAMNRSIGKDIARKKSKKESNRFVRTSPGFYKLSKRVFNSNLPQKQFELTLSMEEFIRSIKVNKSEVHTFFLGAGASLDSGVPLAQDCILEWKKEIYLSHNPNVKNQLKKLSLSRACQKIQKWLDEQGDNLELGDPDEYSFYITKCYPREVDRRKYFKKIIKDAEPSSGYNIICKLFLKRFVDSVWTTNFDGLMAAATQGHSVVPHEIGLDSTKRLKNRLDNDELLIVSLHGDFRYDKIKNTKTEIQKKEQDLFDELEKRLQKNPLIVIGYSGRDDSVMEVFNTVYSNQQDCSIYWCGYYGSEISNNVKKFLFNANNNNNHAHFVPILGFDHLMDSMWQQGFFED